MIKEGSAELERYMSEPEKIGATPILVGCDHRSMGNGRESISSH